MLKIRLANFFKNLRRIAKPSSSEELEGRSPKTLSRAQRIEWINSSTSKKSIHHEKKRLNRSWNRFLRSRRVDPAILRRIAGSRYLQGAAEIAEPF